MLVSSFSSGGVSFSYPLILPFPLIPVLVCTGYPGTGYCNLIYLNRAQKVQYSTRLTRVPYITVCCAAGEKKGSGRLFTL